MGGRRTPRALAWAALAAQPAFVATWLIAGALEPHYDHLRQAVSELAARNAANPAIVSAGLALLGLSMLALAVALALVLPRRRALAVALFAATGVAILAAAALPADCGVTVDAHCHSLWLAGDLSWQHYAHGWSSLAEQLLIMLTPFAVARALWPGTAAAVALAAGAAGLAIAVASVVAYFAEGAADGLIQRADLAVVHVWVAIVAIGVLHATRGEAAPGELVRVPPRAFLATAWSGSGELVLRPFVLGRLVAQRFEAHRASTSISDRVWRIDDEAHFGAGRVERRHMFCEFVAEDRIRLTAGDLPDGLDVTLEPGGFRVAPFRMSYPIGPLPLIVRMVDRSRVEPDGTLVNSFDIQLVGLRVPLGRVTFRVRPATAA
ncbi:MAG: hypothetical protein QOG63_2924 [Thermoleophilaceae bacterium]|nr:hypothetical protein [Thermoleophilaceae bacterium]